jgi:pyruvyltransferase
MIASSSLHGLILADAYGIPNVWMCLNKDTGGGEFKFKDYYEGVLKEYVRYDVGNQIEESSILRCCKDYEGITFDSQKLLKACPFL